MVASLLLVSTLALRVPPPRMAASSPIGFIGIGIMGDGMARCLLNANCDLVVWNRREEKSKALQAEAPAAVKIAETPADVVRACERTYVMLPTPEACAEVYSMSGGILEGISTGKAVIDCATLEPSDMERLDALVTGAGGRFAEAPVSGSKVPAEQGALIFMVAGDENLYKEAAAELDAMGKASVYCGAVGAATKMKLVVNMVMGAQLAAVAEGVALAEALGLPAEQVPHVLDNGAMASPMLKLKGPKMAASEHAPNFPLKWMQKDLRFALATAESVAQPLPVAAAANAAYVRAVAAGSGDLDFSAVVETCRPRG